MKKRPEAEDPGTLLGGTIMPAVSAHGRMSDPAFRAVERRQRTIHLSPESTGSWRTCMAHGQMQM